MTGRLAGKVAVVTGGSRGIGAAIARAFAANGAKVVIASRKLPGLQAQADAINADHPGSVAPRACHMGKLDEIAGLFQFAEETFGAPPTVLVNNAATNPYFGPMTGTPMSAWDKTFEVNLKGPFVAITQLVERLQRDKLSGSIINITSVAGKNAAPLQGVYGMTKAAMISMTRTLAMELGGHNIRVNAIAPGLVETKLAAVLIHSPDLLKTFTDRTPLGRPGQPSEIAGAAVFLASDESSFLTGEIMTIDGGYTIT